MAGIHAATKLAYDDEGAGTPVALLHGLTFDRRTWRPISERLDSSCARSIAVDLPAHGESGGAPAPPPAGGGGPPPRSTRSPLNSMSFSVRWRSTARSWSDTRCRVHWRPCT